METMRLIIIEDDELLLGNLSILLDGEPGVEVVGRFSSAEEALPEIKGKKPDVLLVDLGLPGRSGVELIREAKQALPEVDILAHTVFQSRDMVFSAIKAGASGYILKGCTPRELIEALHSLHQGGAPMSPKIARAVICEIQEGSHEPQDFLTSREKSILRGLEQGYTYNEIADQLCISPHTVHSHIKKIYDKLHARGRQSAILKARKKGIL